MDMENEMRSQLSVLALVLLGVGRRLMVSGNVLTITIAESTDCTSIRRVALGELNDVALRWQFDGEDAESANFTLLGPSTIVRVDVRRPECSEPEAWERRVWEMFDALSEAAGLK